MRRRSYTTHARDWDRVESSPNILKESCHSLRIGTGMGQCHGFGMGHVIASGSASSRTLVLNQQIETEQPAK